jgi:hypothetical protein
MEEKSPSNSQISAHYELETTISISFMKVFSQIPRHPFKTSHAIVEYVDNILETEVISDSFNRHFDLRTRFKLRIL